jgi:ABC-type phosphate/phosphonate transport system substrate-binding protein
MAADAFLMGAVAYDPKVVTIWNGFRAWLVARGLPFDYLLYSNYERQVEDLLAGHIHAAWNSPLAWVRARRLASGRGLTVRPLVMRDTDCDLTSVVVVRANAGITAPEQLRGRVVGVGAVDSPQATLLPLAHLHALGLRAGSDVHVRRFNVGVGLHGDHVGG